MHFRLLPALAILAAFCARAENASKPLSDPVLETPTLTCLGIYWIISGDDNRNAKIEFYARKTGYDGAWKRGPDLFRVERADSFGDQSGKPRPAAIAVPKDAWLFAGSIFFLEPGTEYDLKLKLIDPDGGNAERTLTARTIAEPFADENAPKFHVVPGCSGGDGSESNPFRGIKAAEDFAQPGDIFLLHAGTYKGAWNIAKSGEPGLPIVWRGVGDGEVRIDAGCPIDKLEESAIKADDKHDVWFEKLTIRNAYNLIRAHNANHIVVRRCHFKNGICGVFAMSGTRDMGHFFICDNVFEGIQPWPTTHEQWEKLPESRGVWMGGTGNVVCYNRFEHWKDGIDMADGLRCDACDFHNNEVSECFDDGTELDGSERNTRCFFNRYTNVFQGISFQPVYGGPVYAFRNVLYNCQVEPFKLHNIPSGGLMIHNTILRKTDEKQNGIAMLSTGQSPHNCYSRNNLYLGTGGRALHYDPIMIDCDYDYDGFGGLSGDVFLKWCNVKYPSLEEVRAKCPVEKHLTVVDPQRAFASGLLPPADNQKVYIRDNVDVRLSGSSEAIDAGEILPGFNDDFTGKVPDLGAYEFGKEVPHYGPR